MKEIDNILTLHEAEQLCTLYLDCQLSVLEEAELQYALDRLRYSSPIIDETRRLMALTTVTSRPASAQKKSKRLRLLRIAGIAAMFAIAIGSGSVYVNRSQSSTTVIAYEHGKKLDSEEAAKAVSISIAKAEALIAEAQATEKAATEKQTYLMNLKPDTK